MALANPPSALIAAEAQRAVAGYLLLEPSGLQGLDLLLDPARVTRFLPATDLTRLIYDAACQGNIGWTAIADPLIATGTATAEALEALAAAAPLDPPLAEIERIDEYYQRSRGVKASMLLAEQFADPAKDLPGIFANADRYMAAIPLAAKRQGANGQSLLATNAVEETRKYPPARYIDTRHLFKYTGIVPLVEGTNNGIAAEAGTGKSVLGFDVLVEWAIQGARCVMLSYEMSGDMYLDWLYARYTGMTAERVLMGRTPTRKKAIQPFTPDEQALVDQADEYMSDWIGNITFFDPMHNVPLSDAYALLHPMRLRGELDLVMVDHLQQADVPGDGEVQRATNASRECMKLATRLAVPLITISQLNRKEGGDGDSIQQMGLDRLRASGNIGQDLSSACFLQKVIRMPGQGNAWRYIPYRRGMSVPPNGTLCMLGQVAKNRTGGGEMPDWCQPIVPREFRYLPVAEDRDIYA